MSKDKTYRATLQLDDINHLFEKPGLSPMSDDYREWSYTYGLNFVADELYAKPSHDAVELTILLPAEQVEPGLVSRVKEGIRRYCQGKQQCIEHDISAERWRGFRSLLVGLVALVGFIGASRLVHSDEVLLLQIVSEGLAVAGWVALWVPLERLTFVLWGHRLDRKVYGLLMDMELVIQAAD